MRPTIATWCDAGDLWARLDELFATVTNRGPRDRADGRRESPCTRVCATGGGPCLWSNGRPGVSPPQRSIGKELFCGRMGFLCEPGMGPARIKTARRCANGGGTGLSEAKLRSAVKMRHREGQGQECVGISRRVEGAVVLQTPGRDRAWRLVSPELSIAG